ncbi:MAG: S8 family serine peptidase, partial [Verrucomicrobiales bacterium]
MSFLILLATLLFAHDPAEAQVHDFTSPPSSRQLIVRFRPGVPADARAKAVKPFGVITNSGAQLLQRQTLRNQPVPEHQRELALLQLNPGQKLEEALESLAKSRDLVYAEPNLAIRLFKSSPNSEIIPNDFDFRKLFALSNSGQNGGKPGADISALEAWKISTGSSNIIVAVIDTGIDFHHPDLRPNLWVNRTEISGNGIDDDGNGWIDDIHGYDFDSDDSDPMDDHGHGTHVAGTIGAKGNNNIGIAGVNWDIQMMALKAFDETGNGDLFAAIQAIDYAVANGARIINASWGLDDKSRALEETVQSAIERGVVFVAASGNDKTETPSYPAGYPGVISVGATTSQDERALFSNYGSTVALSAPGQDILSTLPRNSYGINSGTSMAAPHVSGAAALILAQRPGFTVADIRDILVNSADSIATDRPMGRGRLNLFQALQIDSPLPKLEIQTVDLRGLLSITGSAHGENFAGYSLYFSPTGSAAEDFNLLYSGANPVTNGSLAVIDSTALPEGGGLLKLVATNRSGKVAMLQSDVTVSNIRILYPLPGDVFKHGESIQVRGHVSDDRQFYLSLGRGLKPQKWERITAISPAPSSDATLTLWDTSVLPPDNFYALKLTAWNETSTNEHIVSALYLDQHLKRGFPAYIPSSAAFPDTEWRQLRSADLDGNGKQELIFVDPPLASTSPAYLTVLNHNGSLLWKTALPGSSEGGEIPVVGDLQNSGSLQIFVESGGQLHAFSATGQAMGGNWPITLQAAKASKVLADANGDGKLELITYSQETIFKPRFGENHLLSIYDPSGQILQQWEIPTTLNYVPDQPIFPVVADLDRNGVPEIVSVYWDNQLAAFQMGRKEPIWIASTSGLVVSSPVAGDLDGDGKLEVVVGAAARGAHTRGGLHLFKHDGKPARAWPMLVEESFTISPTLGDVDGDGLPEIAAVSPDFYKIHLLAADGFELNGWPVNNNESATLGSISFADLAGDAKQELVFASPGYLWLAMLDNDPTYAGGIKIWNHDASVANFTTNSPTRSLYMEGSQRKEYHKSAPALIVDLDGNGYLDVVSMSVQELFVGVDKAEGRATKNRSGIYAWELPGPGRAPAQWPMGLQNPQNNAVFSSLAGSPPVSGGKSDRAVTYEDLPITLDVLTNDFPAPSPNAVISHLQQPTNGIVTINAIQHLIYTPSADFHGQDRFFYKNKLGSAESELITVDVMVKALNDPPVVTNQNLSVNRNSYLNIVYQGADAEGSRLTYRIVSPPAHGELWAYPNVASYYPHAGYSGKDYFGVVANDGELESSVSYVFLEVTATNNPPRAVPQNLVSRANRSISITLSGVDDDKDDKLTYRISAAPTGGTLTQLEESLGQFLYQPSGASTSNDEFSFEAGDGKSWSKPAKVRIEFTEANTAPTVQDMALTTQANTALQIQLHASDPENDPLRFTIFSPPIYGKLEGNSGRYLYTPPSGFVGADRFFFQVSDGVLDSAPAEVTIHVASTNKPPVASSQSFQATTNTAVSFQLHLKDDDGQVVSAIILRGPAHGRLYGSGSAFTYIPDDFFAGLDSFSYYPWDGEFYGEPVTAYIFVGPLASADVPRIDLLEQLGDGHVRLKM